MSLIDIEQTDALIAYCRRVGLIAPHEIPHVRVLTGGVANKTVWVDHSDGTFVIKQALGKFRVQADWFVAPERSHLEALALQAYETLCPSGSVPHFLYEDEASFIHAMSAIPQPHDTYKQLLLAGQGRLLWAQQAAALMAHVHLHALAHADTLRRLFGSLEHFESQRLEPFYAYTATQVPAAADFLHTLIAQTRTTQITLVHGDFTPKNILIWQEKLVLLDFEIVHWGDPAFDAGLALAHLLLKAIHVRDYTAAYTQHAVAFATHYLRAIADTPLADGLEARIIAHTLACLLARVKGRSPVEYLTGTERAALARVVPVLMAAPPGSLTALTLSVTSL